MAQRKVFWAISLNKHFVEIRHAKRKPRAIKTDCERESKISIYTYYMDADGHIAFKKDNKLRLTNTIHTGGKAVKVIDSHAFWRSTHVTIPVGECYKLNAIQALKVLGKEAKNVLT